MKKSRKLISLLMALAMIFALAIPAFAATTNVGTGDGTITITNAVNGETYTAYKMLELSYNTTTGSYSYTVADKWLDFFNSKPASEHFDIDADGYVTCDLEDDADALATIAKAALEYATNTLNGISAAGSVVAADKEAVITGLELGYYLVDTSLGTLCSIDSTSLTARIVEKNDKDDEPDVDKTVNGKDNNSASIGDVLSYSITVSNVSDKSNVKVSDTLSNGLTLDTTSIKVTVNGADVATTNYTLDTTTTSNSFTIKFEDSYLVGMTSDIVITYTATVNENAKIGTDPNTNEAILSYGNSQSTSDTTKTYVYSIDIFKYTNVETTNGDETTATETALSDAKFCLFKYVDITDDEDNTNSVPDYAVVDGGKLTAWTTTVDGATELVSDTDGKISVVGLAAGTYYLVETEAPTGYNKLSETITVVIADDGTVTYSYGTTEGTGTIKVLNNAGPELPSTGGMGTTLFYIFGGAMVLCAVVLLVTRRRMDNEQ